MTGRRSSNSVTKARLSSKKPWTLPRKTRASFRFLSICTECVTTQTYATTSLRSASALRQLHRQVEDTAMHIGNQAYAAARTVYACAKSGFAGAALQAVAGELGKRFGRRSPSGASVAAETTSSPPTTSTPGGRDAYCPAATKASKLVSRGYVPFFLGSDSKHFGFVKRAAPDSANGVRKCDGEGCDPRRGRLRLRAGRLDLRRRGFNLRQRRSGLRERRSGTSFAKVRTPPARVPTPSARAEPPAAEVRTSLTRVKASPATFRTSCRVKPHIRSRTRNATRGCGAGG